MPVTLERSGEVSILRFDDGENRFTSAWLDEVDRALDDVVAQAPTALVTTGTGKFYSNGLDVDQLMTPGAAREAYLARVQRLLAKVLTLGVPTVAAVNGHAFGAGAMLALAHDFRVMNSEKGFFCLPEIDLKLSFAPGMARLIQSKVTPAAAIEAMTTGRRYGGPDASAAAFVDAVAAPDELETSAIERAAALVGKDVPTLTAIKSELFTVAVEALRA
ncbi:enoyl-CoA hydratase/isomerase family protein [Gryllotalpicola daejeonensis]|uniref:Enoyl-CoA hydratase/isomerase family protein n=1 Tax=Gryllotalpicola daejeonensis TaxID=993087 RepID=A0ABP7ZKR4_9MICO